MIDLGLHVVIGSAIENKPVIGTEIGIETACAIGSAILTGETKGL